MKRKKIVIGEDVKGYRYSLGEWNSGTYRGRYVGKNGTRKLILINKPTRNRTLSRKQVSSKLLENWLLIGSGHRFAYVNEIQRIRAYRPQGVVAPSVDYIVGKKAKNSSTKIGELWITSIDKTSKS